MVTVWLLRIGLGRDAGRRRMSPPCCGARCRVLAVLVLFGLLLLCGQPCDSSDIHEHPTSQDAGSGTGSGEGSTATPATPTQMGRMCSQSQYLDADNETCRNCMCDPAGAVSNTCEDMTGECSCLANIISKSCSGCADTYFRPSSNSKYLERCMQACSVDSTTLCQACLCSEAGANGSLCDMAGRCVCHQQYMGDRCDDCRDNYIYTQARSCVQVGSFFLPYGNGENDRVSTAANVEVSLTPPFPIGQNAYSSLWISSAGFLSSRGNALPNDTSAVVIAPFFINDGKTRSSQVFYQTRMYSTPPGQITNILNASSAVDVQTFSPTFSLTVTWVRVSDGPEPGSTFQAVLTTDGCVSYLILNYMNGTTPTTGTQAVYANVFVRDMQSVLWQSTANSLRYGSTVLPLTSGMCRTSETLQLCRTMTSMLTPVTQPNDALCPSLRDHAHLHPSFALLSNVSDNCFTNLFGSRSLVCCYDGSGSFLSTGLNASFVSGTNPLTNTMQFSTELMLRSICCQSGFCNLFYDVRPRLVETGLSGGAVADALLANQIRIGLTFGDPHFSTLDGALVTFNGLGEYELLNAYDAVSNTSMVVQIRTQLLPMSTATFVSAASFGYYRGPFSARERLIQLQAVIIGSSVTYTGSVPGVAMAISMSAASGTPVSLGSNGYAVVHSVNNQVTFTFSSGAAASVIFSSVNDFNFLAVQSILNNRYINNTRGLLGRLNDDPSDDFESSNGTNYPTSVSSRFYHTYIGSTWEISSNDSTFVYPTGVTTETFSNSSHMPIFLDEVNFTSFNLSACNNSLVCLFDSLETNDTAVGTVSVGTLSQVVNERDVLGNFPPTVSGAADMVSVSLNRPISYNVTVSDPDGPGLPTVTYTTSGQVTVVMSNVGSVYTFVITVTSPMSPSPSFRVMASDSRGASTVVQPLVIFCPCLNSQSCLPTATGADGGAMRTITAQCSCSDAYVGGVCERDRDGCMGVSTNCFTGVMCVDRPAPLTGYTCGSCPAGYTGNGVMCTAVPTTAGPTSSAGTTPMRTVEVGVPSPSNHKWIPPAVIAICFVIIFFIIFAYVMFRKHGTVTYHIALANSDPEERLQSASRKSGEVVPLAIINPAFEDTAHDGVANGNGTAQTNGAADTIDGSKKREAIGSENDTEPDTIVNGGAVEEAEANNKTQEFSERPIDVANGDQQNSVPQPSNNGSTNGKSEYPVLFL